VAKMHSSIKKLYIKTLKYKKSVFRKMHNENNGYILIGIGSNEGSVSNVAVILAPRKEQGDELSSK
jgi:hypothetical protein